jgi:hypothetical protein
LVWWLQRKTSGWERMPFWKKLGHPLEVDNSGKETCV